MLTTVATLLLFSDNLQRFVQANTRFVLVLFVTALINILSFSDIIYGAAIKCVVQRCEINGSTFGKEWP